VAQANQSFFSVIQKPHHQEERSFPFNYHTQKSKQLSIHLVFNLHKYERIFSVVLP